MAQYTPYADVHLNTRAIANYNNPMFDVLRSGLGWLENQGQQIADRKKAELLKQIQNEDMIDRYTQAKNAKEDLAKQLYGDSYFINSNDADLDRAMEALKIKESNRMLDTVGRDIVSKVNQDVYKAGNEQELLSALGFNNRTTKELNDIRDFAQQQLKGRYEPYIQGKLADREVEEGKVAESDIDNLVEEFKNKYGMDVNPADLYNTTKRKDYRQAAVNSRIAQAHRQILNKTASPEDIVNYLYMLQGVNPENTVEISNAITNFNNIKNKGYTDSSTRILKGLLDKMHRDSPNGSIDYNDLRAAYMEAAMTIGIPAEQALEVYNKYVLSDGSLNPEYQRLLNELNVAKKVFQDIEGTEMYKKFNAAQNSVASVANNQDLKNAFNQAIRGNQEIHEGDFNDFMAFLYASNINPETLIGEGKDAVATIKAAMKGFKDNVLYWRKSKDNVNAAQLMFNNANHYGSLLSR